MVRCEMYISIMPRNLEYQVDISCFIVFITLLLFLNSSWFPSRGTSN